jgi:cold shock CspA family protein
MVSEGMRSTGRIKFLDSKTGRWGFITPDDGSPDVHFAVENFADRKPKLEDEGRAVAFDIASGDGARTAQEVRFVGGEGPQLRPPQGDAPPGRALLEWAFVPITVEFTAKSGKQYSSALEYLAQLALDEKWYFGPGPTVETRPAPILDNYLRYTFVKVQTDDQIAYGSDEHGKRFATFNTGLVDKLYDPVFMLVVENHRANAQEWAFYDFCSPGKGPSGKKLTSVFDPLPEPPRYFASNFDMLLDTSRAIYVDYEHVVLDGIQRDRFPPQLLAMFLPEGLTWREYGGLSTQEKQLFLLEFREALERDPQCMRGLKEKLENALDLAWKRTNWNYKTAIPQYYPKHNKMSLLLPLALLQDNQVDVALVVTRNPSGSYQGRTVLPLDWAYQNARLVCRPDSDWLNPSDVPFSGVEALEDFGSDETASDSENEVSGAGVMSAGAGEGRGEMVRPFSEAARSEEDPLESYSVGDVVTGTVEGLKPFGAFVELADGLKGLLHVSEIAEEYVNDPSDYLSEGQALTLRVAEVDRSRGRISFSLKGLDGGSGPQTL